MFFPRFFNPGSAGPNEELIQFQAENITGLVQVKKSYEEPWRSLQKGEKLEPTCFIRTGFNSSAEIVMIDGARKLKMKLTSLLPEFELYDAYDKLLSPEAYNKYMQERCNGKKEPDRLSCIGIVRDTLRPIQTNDFLAMNNLNMETKGRADVVAVGGGGGGGSC